MQIKSFTFNPFQENTYVIYDKTKECVIIDPGCYSEDERATLKEFISKKKLRPVKLINTHCHIDHILGNKFASEQWDIELYTHKEELPILESSAEIGKIYGLKDYERSPYPKNFLDQGDIVRFGKNSFEVLFTPGHAPGHISLHNKENKLLIAGDVIFQGSIGRTDLPGGDYKTLIKSIRKRLFLLPNETKIFCGHGDCTNIGFEKKNNPFLRTIKAAK